MKLSFISVVALVLASLLLITATLSLKGTLTTNVITSRLDSFSRNPGQTIRNTDKLLVDVALTSTATAHHLNSIVLLDQWISYLNERDKSYLDSKSILQTSVHIRPTWPNTYVELAKISESQIMANRYQQLASLFGPYDPSSQLLMIDNTFTEWVHSDLDKQIEASNHLVSIARIWRHRPALDSMLTYSSGKHRMCSLLTFNQIRVQACG